MRNFYNKFFCIPVHEKVSEKVFLTRISLSLLSMLICLVVFCTGTWAYFTATISSETTTIMAATYDLRIKYADEYISDKSFTCSGSADNSYAFTLEAIGTAENGYCVIYIDDDTSNPYYTVQIKNDYPITIQIKAAEGTTVRFEPRWGTYTAFANGKPLYGDNDMIVCFGAETLIETPIENDDYILHVVTDGETLATIALLYQIPITAICEYNEMTEETILVVGQQIAIPKNYVVEDSYETADDESEEIAPTEDTAMDNSAEIEETEESNGENNDDTSNSDDDSQVEDNSTGITDSTETESEQGSQLGDESDLDIHQTSEDSSDITDNEATNNPKISSEEAFVDEAALDPTGDSETDPSAV